MAEYEGLLAGLRAAKSLGVRRLLAKGDLQLVVNQVSKEYRCSDEIMAQYLDEVKKLEKHFRDFEVQHIPRKENSLADQLSKLGSSRTPVPTDVFLEYLTKPSIETGSTTPEVGVIEQDAEWIKPLSTYLASGTLPDDPQQKDRLIRRARMYKLVEGSLYRKGAHGVLMRCISQDSRIKLLKEIHGGLCGTHASYRTWLAKLFGKDITGPPLYKMLCILLRSVSNVSSMLGK